MSRSYRPGVLGASWSPRNAPPHANPLQTPPVVAIWEFRPELAQFGPHCSTALGRQTGGRAHRGMAGGRDARAKARVRQQNHHADAAAVLDKLKLLKKTTLDHLNELAEAVQQGEAQQAYLPELAAAMPAARGLLNELKAQQMQQLTAQMLVLVEKAHAGRPGEMNGYYGDLFEEGDDDGNAELDFEEFARLMEIIAPSFQGAELRAAFLGAGGSLCPLSATAPAPRTDPTRALIAGRPRRRRDGRPARVPGARAAVRGRREGVCARRLPEGGPRQEHAATTGGGGGGGSRRHRRAGRRGEGAERRRPLQAAHGRRRVPGHRHLPGERGTGQDPRA